MKKWMWVVPAFVFAISAAAVLYLEGRDIDPAAQIQSSSGEYFGPEERARAIGLFEESEAVFEAALSGGPLPEGVLETRQGLDGEVLFVLDEKFGEYTKSISKGGGDGYDSLGPAGYNLRVRKTFFKGDWACREDSVLELTFSKRYSELFLAALGADGEGAEISIVLAGKAELPSPADRSKGAYAVILTAKTPEGRIIRGYADPKTKLFLGLEPGE